MKSPRSSLIALACLVALGLSASPARGTDIVIGLPSWASAKAMAYVLKTVIEDRLGLEVELRPGASAAIFKAMDAGDMHVHPEVWLPNQIDLHRTFVENKNTIRAHATGVLSSQGICVTRGTVARTGIEKLAALSDPAMARNFDTDGDGKGEMWIGAEAFASTAVEKVRARSYGYDRTMALIVMDEDMAAAEVDAAVAGNRNIVFYCYTPWHLFAVHDLVVLEEPKHDPAKWHVIPPADDPQWLEKSVAAVAWDLASLNIHYAAELETSHPPAAALLSKVVLDTDTASRMVHALVIEKQDPVAFARRWVDDNRSKVDSWLR